MHPDSERKRHWELVGRPLSGLVLFTCAVLGFAGGGILGILVGGLMFWLIGLLGEATGAKEANAAVFGMAGAVVGGMTGAFVGMIVGPIWGAARLVRFFTR